MAANRRLAPCRSQGQAEAFTRITSQRVGTVFDRTRVAVHALQKEIHHAQASRIGNQFPATYKAEVSGKTLAAGFSLAFSDPCPCRSG